MSWFEVSISDEYNFEIYQEKDPILLQAKLKGTGIYAIFVRTVLALIFSIHLFTKSRDVFEAELKVLTESPITIKELDLLIKGCG